MSAYRLFLFPPSLLAGCVLPLMLLVLLPRAAFADLQPSTEQFAYGMPVESGGESPVQTILLPPLVYQAVQSTELADVRVFNAKGEVVPHAIRTVERKVGEEHDREPLPLFPLRGPRSGADLSLWVVRSEAGTILSLRQGKNVRQPVQGYLIDASQLQRPLRELLLVWAPQKQGFLTHVRVEGSSDLTHWHVVGEDAVVAQLSYRGHQLHRDRVPLRRSTSRYLRLTWSGSLPVTLTDIYGEVIPSPSEPQRHTITVDAQRVEPGLFTFDVGGPLPLDRVSLHLPQENTLVEAALESAHDPQGPWTHRYRGTLYRVQEQGHTWSTPPLHVRPARHRYWRLRVMAKGGGLGEGLPVMEGEWLSEQLMFVARGEAPYLLAYGSATVEAGAFGAADILSLAPGKSAEELEQFTADLGEQRELGGLTALRPPPAPIPWTRWLLWVLLIGGVGALGVMAHRLLQQVGGPEPHEPPPSIDG